MTITNILYVEINISIHIIIIFYNEISYVEKMYNPKSEL